MYNPYPAGPYFPGQPLPPPMPPMRRSRPLGIVALALLVIAFGAFIATIAVAEQADDLANQRQKLSLTTPMYPWGGPTTVELDADTQYVIAGSSITGTSLVHIDAVDAQGHTLPLTAITDDRKMHGEWVIYTFTVPASGVYTFTGTDTVLSGCAIYDARIGTLDSITITCGICAGMAGIVGFVLGIVWLSSRRPQPAWHPTTPTWGVPYTATPPPPWPTPPASGA